MGWNMFVYLRPKFDRKWPLKLNAKKLRICVKPPGLDKKWKYFWDLSQKVSANHAMVNIQIIYFVDYVGA